MARVIIIHGSFGSPEENWFPWLKKELEKSGYNVEVPNFPTPKGQSLVNWLNVFKNYTIDKDTILIGHSLGPAFILTLLEKNKVRACFFVSGFISTLNKPEFDNINESFINKNFNWKNIKENCKNFYLYHSDNDPYVPIEKAEELKKKLNSNLKIIKDAGHFNTSSGYLEFKELLKDIKNLNFN